MHDPSNPNGNKPSGQHGQPHQQPPVQQPYGAGTQPQPVGQGQYVQPGPYVQPGQYVHGAPRPGTQGPYPGSSPNNGNKKKFIIAGVSVVAIGGLVGIGLASESCGDDKSETGDTTAATGIVGSTTTTLTKPETAKKNRLFDVSMEEAFSAGDFEYKVTKLRVARSVGGYARASEGARFLTIFFDQKNTSAEPKTVAWFRDFTLTAGDGKKYTASKVGTEALLLKKRGINYRETEVQSGIAFQGGVAFELPLAVIDDPRLVFHFAHVQGDKKTRVFLQKPEIAKWILVEPYLRSAMANPTTETVKKAMGSTDASDSAIENYAAALKQFMDAYNTEVAERKARRRSMKNLQVISAEQEGDMLTITRLLKKKGKASERPKLKLVTKETPGGDFVLTSIALSFGNK